MSLRVRAVVLAGVAFAVACADDAPVDPSNSLEESRTAVSDTAARGQFPSVAHVQGRVIAGTDTTSTSGVSGIRIQFTRNYLDNGAARQRLEAEIVSGSDGRFEVAIPGGYYVVSPLVAADAPYQASTQYLAALKEQLSLVILVGRK